MMHLGGSIWEDASGTPMKGLKKCQNLAETFKFLGFLSPIQTLTIS